MVSARRSISHAVDSAANTVVGAPDCGDCPPRSANCVVKHVGDVSERRVEQPQQLASVCGGLKDLHDRHRSWPVGDREGWMT